MYQIFFYFILGVLHVKLWDQIDEFYILGLY